MSFGTARARTRQFTTPQCAADYLDAHLVRHYRKTFVGALARVPERRLVLLVAEPRDPECRADARRWLDAFGPSFCDFELELAPAPEPAP